MKLVALSKRRAKTCGPTRSLAMRAGMQSQLDMDLAADSLSTWRAANKASGLNDLSRADGMPMRMRTIEGIAPVLPALPADRVRQLWSVVTLVSR